MRRKQVKFDQEIFEAELKRFRLLNEYDFYIGEEEGDDPKGDISKLMLDEDPEGDDMPVDDPEADAEVGQEAPAADAAPAPDAEGGEDLPLDDLPTDEPADAEPAPAAEPAADMPPAEDEVELDVTDLVKNTEDAKQASDMTNQRMDDLMRMVDMLDNKLNSMDGITKKIDDLENELEKRTPTPEEKLEMRSLSSYPYNLKLTDFWADKTDQYDVMGKEDEGEKEFVLTQKDIDDEYNDATIQKSFDADYDEEDIV